MQISIPHRRFFGILFGLALLSARGMAAEPFMIVALPDTQIYAQKFPATFHTQTRWIVDNRERENIVFVTQEGDIVQSAEGGNQRNLEQWKVADAAISRLDGDLKSHPNGLVPYSVAIGNHDYGRIGVKSAGTDRYLEFFGPDRYKGRSWYGGHSPDGLSHFQIFQAGGRKFLHVALEWEPDKSVVAWAQSVITAHPGLPTFITTHAYLTPAHGRSKNAESKGGFSGEQMFQTLVRPNAQVFLVMNGHFSGENHQTSTNAAGQPVFEMVTDYQSRPNGGDGFMPLLTFDEDAGEIRVRTYSPLLKKFEIDKKSEFTFKVNFKARLGPVTVAPLAPPSVKVAAFRQGENGYLGCVDTCLKEKKPTTSYGTSTGDLLSDAATENLGNTSHVLIRFDNLFGVGGGRIPAGATILSAELVTHTNEPDPA